MPASAGHGKENAILPAQGDDFLCGTLIHVPTK